MNDTFKEVEIKKIEIADIEKSIRTGSLFQLLDYWSKSIKLENTTIYRKLEVKSSQNDDGHHKAAAEGHLKVISDAEQKLKKYSQLGQFINHSLYYLLIKYHKLQLSF